MRQTLEKRLLIHPGEGGNVLYFLIFFLLVSAGMAIGRSSADALFLKRLGIEYLPVMYLIQSVLLAAVSLVYTAFADRLPAEKFFRNLFGILILLVFASWLVISTNGTHLVYPAYYLIYEVSSEILLVHAALYMNQNMTTIQAKRLAPLVFAGAQTGTIIGGLTLVVLAPLSGTPNLLLAWCALLLISSAALYVRHKRYGASTHYRAPAKSRRMLRASITQVQQGLKYTWSSRLLRASSLSLFFMVLAFYILCYSVNRVYTQTFESEESLARFFGLLTATTSVLALLLQVFITNRVIRNFGVRATNLVFPWTTVASLGALTMSFTLPAALVASMNKDALMPAFRNPVRAMFFNVLPDYIQGRSRAIAVAVVLPLALMSGGLLLLVMQNMGNPLYFLVPGILAAFAYLYFNKKMNDAYVSTLISTLKERLQLPDSRMYEDLKGCSDNEMQDIMRGVTSDDTDVSLAFSRALAKGFPDKAANIIIDRATSEESATVDRYIKLLAPLELASHTTRLVELADKGDAHLQASIMRLLLEQDEKLAALHAKQLISSNNPRLRAIAICASLRYPGEQLDPRQATEAWKALLSQNRSTQLASLALIPDMGYLDKATYAEIESAYLEAFQVLLQDADQGARTRTLISMQHWKGRSSEAIQSYLPMALSSEIPEMREAACRCLHMAGADERDSLLLKAIGDASPQVRESAIEVLYTITERPEELALNWVRNNDGTLRTQRALLEKLVNSRIPLVEFTRVVRIKSEQARRLGEARAILEDGFGSEARYALLLHFLKEQFDQTIDLALLALEPLYEPGVVKTIRTGYASGDIRYIAQAHEALENLDKRGVAADLGKIMQESINNNLAKADGYFRSHEDIIDWCRERCCPVTELCIGPVLQPQRG